MIIFIWFWLALGYRLLLRIKIGKRREVSWGISLKRNMNMQGSLACRTWWSNGFVCGTRTYSRLRQMIYEETIPHACIRSFVSFPICMTLVRSSDTAIFIKWLTPVMFVLRKIAYKLCRSCIFVIRYSLYSFIIQRVNVLVLVSIISLIRNNKKRK